MCAILDSEHGGPCATHGDIAAINLESARRRAWARFLEDPRRHGVAEEIVDKERLGAQFLGDLDALDRLDALASHLAHTDDSVRASLVQAEVASTAHRFDAARQHLKRASQLDGPSEAIERQSLAVDQACGIDLDAVLGARRRLATKSGRLEDLVPLGAVLADLKCFMEADATYREAFRCYEGASPFPPAWVCFQLGMLWGELVPESDSTAAALWYRRAIAYFPRYVKARVHLAEIYARQDRTSDAEALLLPALSSRDPEVRWRLAEVLTAQGRLQEAETHRNAARLGFDERLGRHLLAFADHAAEFYAGSGGDCRRALDLANANVANRPTCRAVRQLGAIRDELARRDPS